MALKIVILAALLAVTNAGYIGGYGYAAPAYAASAYGAYGHGYASPAITAQSSNILRTPGNLGQVSTYTKSIDTPYSSVRKSDVRVSNDALAYGAAYHAPAYAAAPAYGYARAYAPAGYAAPYAARAVAPAGLLGVAYSAAPAVAHFSYSSGLGLSYGW